MGMFGEVCIFVDILFIFRQQIDVKVSKGRTAHAHKEQEMGDIGRDLMNNLRVGVFPDISYCVYTAKYLLI